MYSYVLRRLAFGALTVVGVSIVVFLIMRVMPGDPLTAIFGPEGMTRLSEEQRASYMRELGLADPLWVQYLRWLGDIARGDLGRSFFRAESVGEMVMRRGPLTAQIADCIFAVLEPRGVAVVIEAAHECMTTRGVGKRNVSTVTSRMLGVFRDDARARAEFLALIDRGR